MIEEGMERDGGARGIMATCRRPQTRAVTQLRIINYWYSAYMASLQQPHTPSLSHGGTEVCLCQLLLLAPLVILRSGASVIVRNVVACSMGFVHDRLHTSSVS